MFSTIEIVNFAHPPILHGFVARQNIIVRLVGAELPGHKSFDDVSPVMLELDKGIRQHPEVVPAGEAVVSMNIMPGLRSLLLFHMPRH